LSADLSKAYELLGVKPGVSNRELKAAHRDLAKVWHPDRFLHDPRLQEKAQEKLKEINEAYDLLSSGKIPRPAPARSADTVYSSAVSPSIPRRRGNWLRAAIPILLFVAVFAITTKTLIQQRSQTLQEQDMVAEQPLEPESSARPDSSTRAAASDKSQKTNQEDPASEVASTETLPSQPALATVTVSIDPESGRLAKADCPLRSRMTYPSGSEPSSYCNINHAPPPKESRLKSLATKVLPGAKKN
jgi:hypothetical protein